MGYTTTYRQNVNHNDLSGMDSIEYASFDIESGYLTWKTNPDIVYYTSIPQVKGKSSNMRW